RLEATSRCVDQATAQARLQLGMPAADDPFFHALRGLDGGTPVSLVDGRGHGRGMPRQLNPGEALHLPRTGAAHLRLTIYAIPNPTAGHRGSVGVTVQTARSTQTAQLPFVLDTRSDWRVDGA